MSPKVVAPALSAKRNRREIHPHPKANSNGTQDAMNMRHNPPHFNGLPLWQAAREAELRALPLDARRIARRFGLDAATARLLASLAGNGIGGRS